MRVFISYTTRDHRDRAQAQQIYEGLRFRGVEAFFAEETIRGGASWKRELRDEIGTRCSHMLVILSATSVVSPEVLEEIALARARAASDASFVILPLVTGAIVNPLSDLHWLEYSEEPEEQLEILARALGLPPRTDEQRRSSGGGDIVPRLCDRREQERHFRASFSAWNRRSGRAPQVYFIVGAEGEKHESLVDRFRWQDLRDFATQVRRDEGASVSMNVVPWPLSQVLDDAQEELLAELFGAFDYDYRISDRELTPQAFRQLTEKRPEPVISIQHEIRSEWWSRSSAEVIERYLHFWADVAALQPPQQFVIFFNVVFAADHDARGLNAFVERLGEAPGKSNDEAPPLWRKVRSLLGTREPPPLPKNILVAPLPRLQGVRRKDVDEWFDKRLPICRHDERQRVTEELFSGDHARPMAVVERRLAAVYHDYSEGRRAS
jgi:inactive STAND/TIR domain